jgi:hypothetical protein
MYATKSESNITAYINNADLRFSLIFVRKANAVEEETK